jgi:monodehydroascorbate reductase (NADH)
MASRACEIAVLGGGNAAGYFARAAAELGLKGVAIVGEEPAVSYERPALSKAYLFPEGGQAEGSAAPARD